MADDAATTVDTAGVTRTTDGQIAPPQPARTPPSSTLTPNQQTTDQQTEPKADDGKSLLNQDGKTDQKTDQKTDGPKGAPDAYSDFTVPEGFTLDPEVAKRAGGLFKELNLSQEGAQKLIDLYAAETKAAFEAPFKAYQDMRKEWQNSVTSDREMGHRLPEIKTAVTQMLNTHLGPVLAGQFREAMDLTGVGDHPAFVRAFDIISQLLTEPRSHVAGKQPSPFSGNQPAQPRSAAQAMYPHLPSNAG